MFNIQLLLCSYSLTLKISCYIMINCSFIITMKKKLNVFFISQMICNYHNFIITFENTDKIWIIIKWFLKLNWLKKFKFAIKINEINKK
jgi:hypothetical protein